MLLRVATLIHLAPTDLDSRALRVLPRTHALPHLPVPILVRIDLYLHSHIMKVKGIVAYSKICTLNVLLKNLCSYLHLQPATMHM